ncbi:2047_t:CDS:1, partial [Acaulospora morrowiae]
MAKNSTTKMSPFFLIYGRDVRQPIHLSSTMDMLDGTILQRTFDLIEQLPRARQNAIHHIQQAQIQQKTYHDK